MECGSSGAALVVHLLNDSLDELTSSEMDYQSYAGGVALRKASPISRDIIAFIQFLFAHSSFIFHVFLPSLYDSLRPSRSRFSPLQNGGCLTPFLHTPE